jgi:ribosomal protein S18 acetylase RimI-like enzyme
MQPDFVARRVAESRQHIAAGHGIYVAALADGVVRAGLGIVTDGSGLGRYQTVETHPDFRRRGLAGALLQLAADTARRDLGVHRFVIVADPDYVAIELYRRAGFSDAEREVKWQRASGSTRVAARLSERNAAT